MSSIFRTVAPSVVRVFSYALLVVLVIYSGNLLANTPVPTWETQKKARVYELSVPAPRGMITDRHGSPLASARVGWDLCPVPSIKGDPSQPDSVAGKWLVPQPREEDVPPERLQSLSSVHSGHYYTSPRYYREYQHGRLAGHILGHVGRRAPLKRGPVENGDLLFTEEEGRDGLEAIFDSVLVGEPGVMTVNVDQSGTSAHRKMSQSPVPGKNVITTLDIGMQRILEEELAKESRPTTAVILDADNGDILAAASLPSYAPSALAPARQHTQSYTEDPAAPMFPRSFRGVYPPASAFKPIVAVAALGSGAVLPEEKLGCPPSVKVGNMVFRNWTTSDSGSMDVASALASSCNTWFYRAALKAGAAPIVRTASDFGFGRGPVLLYPSVAAGLVPDDQYMLRRHGRRIMPGDVANISIGQGDLLVSPLQMALAYAALGNGGVLHRPRLVMQVQEIDNEVVAGYPPRPRRLSISPSALEAVVQGLEKAVSSGTGRSAAVKGVKVAGKTGTTQWGSPSEKKRLAWFCGFAPSPAPSIAFAFLIEGRPHQSLAGATSAALAGRVLRRFKAAGYIAPPAPRENSPPEVELASEEVESPAAETAISEVSDISGSLEEPMEVRPALPVEVYEAPSVDLTPLLELAD